MEEPVYQMPAATPMYADVSMDSVESHVQMVSQLFMGLFSEPPPESYYVRFSNVHDVVFSEAHLWTIWEPPYYVWLSL